GGGGGLWPTPCALDAGSGRVNRSASANTAERPSLALLVNLWPTPTVNGNRNRAGLSPKSGDGLETAVKRLLPPAPARDWQSSHASEATLQSNSRPLNE